MLIPYPKPRNLSNSIWEKDSRWKLKPNQNQQQNENQNWQNQNPLYHYLHCQKKNFLFCRESTRTTSNDTATIAIHVFSFYFLRLCIAMQIENLVCILFSLFFFLRLVSKFAIVILFYNLDYLIFLKLVFYFLKSTTFSLFEKACCPRPKISEYI